MNTGELKRLVQAIVADAKALKDRHTSEPDALVNYACVFSQSESEYRRLTKATQSIGRVIKETDTGYLFQIEVLQTAGGQLQILKIRLPDPTRPERGDADFTVSDYPAFKAKYLSQPGFKLIPRSDIEMIELVEPNCDVRVYFSNPPLDRQLLDLSTDQ